MREMKDGGVQWIERYQRSGQLFQQNFCLPLFPVLHLKAQNQKTGMETSDG